jgi:hypothetical protein
MAGRPGRRGAVTMHAASPPLDKAGQIAAPASAARYFCVLVALLRPSTTEICPPQGVTRPAGA